MWNSAPRFLSWQLQFHQGRSTVVKQMLCSWQWQGLENDIFFWVWDSRLSNHHHRYHKTCGAMEGSLHCTSMRMGGVLNDRRIQAVEIQEHHKVVVQASLPRNTLPPPAPTLLKLRQTNSTSCIQALNSETRQFDFDGAENAKSDVLRGSLAVALGRTATSTRDDNFAKVCKELCTRALWRLNLPVHRQP